MVEVEPVQTTTAPYPAAAVANELISRAIDENRLLTAMQLIRLVYLAEGFYLAKYGVSLLDEPVYACPNGPVVSSLFQELKRFRNRPVTKLLLSETFETASTDPLVGFQLEALLIEPEDHAAHEILDAVWKRYRNLDATQLAGMLRQPGTPWATVWEKNQPANMVASPARIRSARYEIQPELTKQYFQSLATSKA